MLKRADYSILGAPAPSPGEFIALEVSGKSDYGT